MGDSVLDVGEVVRMRGTTRQGKARDLEISTLFGQGDEVVVARHAIAQGDTAEVNDALLHLTHVERRDTYIRRWRLLALDEGEASTAANIDLDGTQCQSMSSFFGAVTEV